jgi:segregation and condensation protein B
LSSDLDEDSIETRIEAALYAAGRPLTVDELGKAAKTMSRRKVLAAIGRISERVRQNLKSIEVVKVKEGSYAMQLRPEFNSMAKKFSVQPLLTKSVLKTLTMVAYFQPVSAKTMAEKRGSSVYNHLKQLEEIGLVASTQDGKNSIYTTTPYFAEYFGLPEEPAQVKEKLRKMFPQAAKAVVKA